MSLISIERQNKSGRFDKISKSNTLNRETVSKFIFKSQLNLG